jgi:hypothetical protein
MGQSFGGVRLAPGHHPSDGGSQVSLKDEFKANPQQFFNDYPVILPGTGNQSGTIDPGGGGAFYPVMGFNKGYHYPANPQYVAWRETGTGEVELVIQGSPYATQLANAGTPVPADQYFKAFFLPWQKGFIGRMDLPQVSPCRFFFTAEMNGCAFLSTGHRSRPTVAHLNVEEPEVGKPMPWEVHRQNTLEAMITATLAGKLTKHERILTKWGAHIHGGGGGVPRAMITAGPTYDRTPLEEAAIINDYHATLGGDNRKLDPNNGPLITDIRVSMMGLRQGDGYWHFYYQRSIYVLGMRTIEKLNSKWKGFKKKIFGDHRPRLTRGHRFIIAGSEYVPFWP